MPRNIDASLLTELQDPLLMPAIFASITFATVIVNIWSGSGTVTWQGITWTGLGSFFGLETIEEGVTVEARGIAITLSGLDPDLLADCMNEFRLGLPVKIYLGFYTSGALNPNAITSWAGRTDQPTIHVAGDQATITINCENRLVDMNVPADRRYTIQDQQMTWPGDLGFQFVQAIQEVTIFWGQHATVTPNI